MQLSYVKPKESSFSLREAGRSFRIRPITLNDEIWLSEVYGSRIQKVFEEGDLREISRIVFRLMIDEDKKFFSKVTKTIVDEYGEESEFSLGGVARLQSMISGMEEKAAILQALLDVIGVSRPELSEEELEANKKKAVKKKTKKKAIKAARKKAR